MTAAKLARGLGIILKYEPGADVCAQHDILYVGNYESRERMTSEDIKTLENDRWFQQEESWAHFT